MKKKKKNKDSVRTLWDNFNMSNIHVIGVPGKRKKKTLEIYLKKK